MRLGQRSGTHSSPRFLLLFMSTGAASACKILLIKSGMFCCNVSSERICCPRRKFSSGCCRNQTKIIFALFCLLVKETVKRCSGQHVPSKKSVDKIRSKHLGQSIDFENFIRPTNQNRNEILFCLGNTHYCTARTNQFVLMIHHNRIFIIQSATLHMSRQLQFT